MSIQDKVLYIFPFWKEKMFFKHKDSGSSYAFFFLRMLLHLCTREMIKLTGLEK